MRRVRLSSGQSDRVRRRDRRGRGIRGPLVPSDLPVYRSRAQSFEDLVLDAVERLERLWARELANVDFLVEPVPPVPARGPMTETIPFSRLERGPSGKARIVVYRRPVEMRTKDPAETALLVHETVVEEVANLLGVEPESVDPEG